MTVRPAYRRLLVGVTSAAVLSGAVGGLSLLVPASAADPCLTWSDPKGDSSTGQLGLPSTTDANLDIVSSSLSAAGDSLVGVIVTDGLIGDSSDVGDEFGFDFIVNGKKLTLYTDRMVVNGAAVPPGAGAGITPGSGAATASYDVKTKTVTIKAKLSELDKAAGAPTTGKELSAIDSYSADQLGTQPIASYDDSATTQKVVVGATCGDAGGTPAATATPTATPSGAASPSPTPGGSPSPTTSASPNGLFDQPRKNCVQYKDAIGDADPSGTGLDNEDSLDVTQVNLKSPTGQLQVYVGLANPASSLSQPFSGRTYVVALTVAGKAVTLAAPGDGAATATVGGTASADLKATAKVDAPHKNVVFTVPLDGLSKAVGATVASGTAITGTAITTKAGTPIGARTADTAAGTTEVQKTYAYGDNTCFKPPAGVFELDADASGQYGDVTELFATLKDADGSPVQGVKVSAVLTGGKPVTATTDDDGIADIKISLRVPAGTKTLTVTYAGDAEVGPAKATKVFTVKAEKTLLKAVGIRGGVQATVVDDDKHPVAGHAVTFTVGGTKRIVKTNSKGVAVLTGVAKGAAVKVVFLVVKGYYLGTPTYTVKAL